MRTTGKTGGGGRKERFKKGLRGEDKKEENRSREENKGREREGWKKRARGSQMR